MPSHENLKGRLFFRPGLGRRLTTYSVLLAFGLNILGPLPKTYAQTIPNLDLPTPGMMIGPSPAFVPVILRGIKVHADNPFQFDFIVDTGNSQIQGDALKEESTKLIKYFLASLAVPEDDLWVNLSPYEKDRIIPEAFGQTEMGRDLLSQDYILKQLTASLMYPENDLGKEFWDRVYQKAKELYGTTDIPINTFNKVWIVPEKAEVYETENTAFVTESHLKIMLEGDYLALQNNLNQEEIRTDQLDSKNVEQLSDVSSQIVKEVILPEIEKEVNEGKNFAQLRQIYNSLILAAWFKRALKESILNKVYTDQNKIAGVDIEDPDALDKCREVGTPTSKENLECRGREAKNKIYQQYLEAFKKGVYDYIKEDYDAATQEVIPRRYFSGGFDGLKIGDTLKRTKSTDPAAVGVWKRGMALVAGAVLFLRVIFANAALPPASRSGEGTVQPGDSKDGNANGRDPAAMGINKRIGQIMIFLANGTYSENDWIQLRERVPAEDAQLLDSMMGAINKNLDWQKERLKEKGLEGKDLAEWLLFETFRGRKETEMDEPTLAQLLRDQKDQYEAVVDERGLIRVIVSNRTLDKLYKGGEFSAQAVAVKMPQSKGVPSFILLRRERMDSEEYGEIYRTENIPHETWHILHSFLQRDGVLDSNSSLERFKDEMIAKIIGGNRQVPGKSTDFDGHSINEIIYETAELSSGKENPWPAVLWSVLKTSNFDELQSIVNNLKDQQIAMNKLGVNSLEEAREVIHAAEEGVELFRGGKQGKAVDRLAEETTIGTGVYLTDEESARKYAALRGGNQGEVRSAHFVGRILDLAETNNRLPEELAKEWREFLISIRNDQSKNFYTIASAENGIKALDNGKYALKNIVGAFDRDFSRFLQEQGYDALKALEGGEGEGFSHVSWVIFDPKKIIPDAAQRVVQLTFEEYGALKGVDPAAVGAETIKSHPAAIVSPEEIGRELKDLGIVKLGKRGFLRSRSGEVTSTSVKMFDGDYYFSEDEDDADLEKLKRQLRDFDREGKIEWEQERYWQFRDNCFEIARYLAAQAGYFFPENETSLKAKLFLGESPEESSPVVLIVREPKDKSLNTIHISVEINGVEYNFGPDSRDGYEIIKRYPLMPVASARKNEETDEAALAEKAPGGIDVRKTEEVLKTKGEGVKFDLPAGNPAQDPLNPVDLQNLQGLTPVIFQMDIIPIQNLPAVFLGIKEEEQKENLSMVK